LNKININRLEKYLEKIANFNSNSSLEEGVTRLTYSKEDKQARDYILNEMDKLGLEIKIDGIGNIVGIYNPKNIKSEEVILTGSHLDTVTNGGKYDGVVGVVAGLESIRTIKDNNIEIKQPVGLVVFVEEEGTTFGSTLIGSKYFSKNYTNQDIKDHYDDQGISMYERAKEFGLSPEKGPLDIKLEAMLEMHVEQSILLERKNLEVGIVDNIAGVNWYKITIKGETNHAGSTPMDLRKDPMIPAAKIISEINNIINDHPSSTIVGTVGKISCHPNVPNVIPGKVSFTIDIRDIDNHSIISAADKIKCYIEKICIGNNFDYNIELLGKSDSIKLSNRLKNIMKEKAEDKGIKYTILNSGAVHDSAMFENLTDVGMIFVPSKDGVSHSPEEFTSYEDIEKGANILLETIVELAK